MVMVLVTLAQMPTLVDFEATMHIHQSASQIWVSPGQSSGSASVFNLHNDIHTSVLNSAVCLFADNTNLSKSIDDCLDTDKMQLT